MQTSETVGSSINLIDLLLSKVEQYQLQLRKFVRSVTWKSQRVFISGSASCFLSRKTQNSRSVHHLCVKTKLLSSRSMDVAASFVESERRVCPISDFRRHLSHLLNIICWYAFCNAPLLNFCTAIYTIRAYEDESFALTHTPFSVAS